MRIVISQFMSLDGIVQAPGGSQEDIDGGFANGGWSMPYFDPESSKVIASWGSTPSSIPTSSSNASASPTTFPPPEDLICHTGYGLCMTMFSFRVDDRDASEAQRWAEALGIDRSELLREALRRHLDRLASEGDADRWDAQPLDGGEQALSGIAEWGPSEDWSDWNVDAAG